MYVGALGNWKLCYVTDFCVNVHTKKRKESICSHEREVQKLYFVSISQNYCESVLLIIALDFMQAAGCWRMFGEGIPALSILIQWYGHVPW